MHKNNQINHRILAIVVFGFLVIFSNLLTHKVAAAESNVTIHLFYSKTCPHCKEEEEFLDEYTRNNEGIEAYAYEVSHKNNRQLILDLGEYYNKIFQGVPITIIGNTHFIGFGEPYKKYITDLVETTKKESIPDIVSDIVSQNNLTPDYKVLGKEIYPDNEKESDNSENNNEQNNDSNPQVINYPKIGNIDTKNVSLPVFTFIIALLDGFNPCAMWTLMFLIGLLLKVDDPFRRWTFGIAFILSSGLVYFLFLAAWLNIFLIVGYAPIIQYAIGLLAIGIGFYYIRDYIRHKNEGCPISQSEKRQKVFKKLRSLIITNKNFVIAVFGIIMLAIAVNVVELFCSAGLPALYTDVLALHNLPLWQYYLYLLFYIIVFMLDDIIVFGTAMWTLKAVGLDSKYAKYSHLIGGVITMLIGFWLIFM